MVQDAQPMVQKDLYVCPSLYVVRRRATEPPSTHSMSAYNPSTVDTIVEMFADNTAGESYGRNRLLTRETGNGNVELVGYTWMRLAEYDESENLVTVYVGHKSVNSRTVSRWLNAIIEQCAERRNVRISDQSPTVDTPNEGVRFIGNYIGSFSGASPVEKAAVRVVEESLDFL